MDIATTPRAPLYFGQFVLQRHQHRLLVAGVPAALGARAIDLLGVLAERAGQLISKRELMDLVWPGLVVEENNVAVQISTLRKVLGDDVIATVPGRGYRFTAQLHQPQQQHGLNPSADPFPAEPAALANRSASEPVAASAGPAALPTNLPTTLPGLLGRSEEIEALGALIRRHRLVSIAGTGGIGKTLLTQHLLDAHRNAFRHGVCWVELAQVTDPAALSSAIAGALGIRTGKGEPMGALVKAMAPLDLLLALDNAEHMASAVADVCQSLREKAPGVRIVVTTQVPLSLANEHVYRVGPLSVPDGPMPAGKALQYSAVALFAERAQAADARFALTDAIAPAVIDLCRALDGLALAIELAAARAPMLGVQRLASSMQHRLNLLNTNRNRDAPARQQTLRCTLEWSHGFLDECERTVFRRMAVAVGSASLELVQQLACDCQGASVLDPWATVDALGVLIDRSLVVVLSTDAEHSAAPRYRLLESARAYATERLVAANEHDTAKRRHAQAMAAHFDAAWDEYYSGSIGHDEWMRKLSFDLDNARDALAWAIEHEDVACALTVGATMLMALPNSFDAERKALTERCEALLALDSPVPVRIKVRALLQVSAQTSMSGRRQQSISAAEGALQLSRQLAAEGGDPFPLYLALCQLANAAVRLSGGDGVVEPTLLELRALQDPGWPAHRLYVGLHAEYVVAAFHGDVAASLQHTRRLVTLARARGVRSCIKQLADLVDSELAAGDPVAAARIGMELVASLEGSRDEYHLNFARLNLVAAWLALDDREAARTVARAGWPHAFRFDLHRYWMDYLALLAALDGRPQVTAQLLGRSDAVYRAFETFRPPNEATAIERAGALARTALGEAEYARWHAKGALLDNLEITDLAFGAA